VKKKKSFVTFAQGLDDFNEKIEKIPESDPEDKGLNFLNILFLIYPFRGVNPNWIFF
jgi:hypothetical protein